MTGGARWAARSPLMRVRTAARSIAPPAAAAAAAPRAHHRKSHENNNIRIILFILHNE